MDYGATIIYKSVNFGVMEGNKGLLVIKTGSGGTIYGHENKYLTLAKRKNLTYNLLLFVKKLEVAEALMD